MVKSNNNILEYGWVNAPIDVGIVYHTHSFHTLENYMTGYTSPNKAQTDVDNRQNERRV